MTPGHSGAAPDDATPGRWSFHASARTSADADAVWSLVGEARRWREWSWMTRTFVVRPGEPAPDGVGAVRRFAVGPFGSREEVVAWDPPRHLGYVAISGLPVRRYRADVEIRSDADGTLVTWTGSFDTIVPGTGPALRMVLRRLVLGFATRVCRYADAQGAHA